MACFFPSSAAQPAPFVFGTGAVFGSGSTNFGGFGGLTGAGFSAAAASKDAGDADGGDDGDEGGAAEEEECTAEFKPIVHLEQVETKTGEEEEETLVEM